MKLALASVRIVDGDIARNLSQMERCLREAKRRGAELVCFGEAFLQGFGALSWEYEEDRNIAVTADSPVLGKIRGWTKELGVDVLFGYYEREGEEIYSSCALISGGKTVCNYRRISAGWKDIKKADGHYREGTDTGVFSYRGRECTVALCGDLWDFPERFTLGETLLFWPVYVSWTKEDWEQSERGEYAAQAGRCCENALYVNSLCENDSDGGAAWFRRGTVAQEQPMCREGLLVVEI